MITQFLTTNDNPALLNSMIDETELFIDAVTNDEMPISQNVVSFNEYINGYTFELVQELKDDNAFITLISIYLDDEENPVFTFEESETGVFTLNDEITRSDGWHSILIIVSTTSIMQYQTLQEYLNDTSIMAFGVFVEPFVETDDEPAEEGLPPELIANPDSTQSVKVLNRDATSVYSTVPDIYDVKISQQINGHYTLNFKLQPYVNASNIYTPRIIEMDNDYFHVQQITKTRNLKSLEMSVSCEHVSYELNIAPERFYDEIAEDYTWTEDTYSGTADEIINEMLYETRFTLTTQFDNRFYTFKTSAEGFRTRLIEFANFINREVRFSKFNISFLARRGQNNGVTLEVGKNIIGMTETIDTTKLGRVKRSYEIDVLDLRYIRDELNEPLSLFDLSLGDTVTLIDNNYLIERTDRIISIEYDPFKKALPKIEFLNGAATFTNSGGGSGLAANIVIPTIQSNIFMEYGRINLGTEMYLLFENDYAEVLSITTGVYTDEQQITLYDIKLLTKIMYENGRAIGVYVASNMPYLTDVYVDVQAICIKKNN